LEDCQLVMAKIQAKLNQQLQHLDYLYQTVETTKKNLEEILDAGCSLDFIKIKNYQGYILKLKEDIKNQHKIISDTEFELEESKQKVLEAMKAKKMLEKLKEKQFKDFIKNLEKHDLLEIDEIATNRHKKVEN